MLGALLGDIVGSRFEFPATNRIKTKDFEFYHKDSHITDDSVCTIAISHTAMDFDAVAVGTDYAMQLISYGNKHPRAGYGKMFKEYIKNGDPEAINNSFGNGAAMRVSSIPWVYRHDEPSVVMSQTVMSCWNTHANMEAIHWACALNMAIHNLLNGGTKATVSRLWNDSFDFRIEAFPTVDNIRKNYQFTARSKDSVPQAFRCFYESTSLEDAIRNAVSLGGDCDTQACIAGALAEAYFGITEEQKSYVLSKLPEDLKAVVEIFISEGYYEKA